MAETGLTRFPVVERAGGRLLGIVALSDLLKARTRDLEAERRRERVLEVRFGLRRRRAADRLTVDSERGRSAVAARAWRR